MYRLNARFLLVMLAFCAGFSYCADAAPSVRVLGTGTGNVKNSGAPKVSAVKTGDTLKVANIGSNAIAKKAASVKMATPKMPVSVPTTKTAMNRIGTETEKSVETKKENVRFPGIMTKSNIQTGNKISTDTSSSSSAQQGYNMQDITNRLNNAETNIGNKVDKTTLNNYYTKTEVEDIRSDYYTKTQVEDRLSAIDTSASSEFIQRLNSKVNDLIADVDDLTAEAGAIYDNNTGDKVNVSFVSTFVADTVLGAEE